jgi:hypothetical protein
MYMYKQIIDGILAKQSLALCIRAFYLVRRYGYEDTAKRHFLKIVLLIHLPCVSLIKLTTRYMSYGSLKKDFNDDNPLISLSSTTCAQEKQKRG